MTQIQKIVHWWCEIVIMDGCSTDEEEFIPDFDAEDTIIIEIKNTLLVHYSPRHIHETNNRKSR